MKDARCDGAVTKKPQRLQFYMGFSERLDLGVVFRRTRARNEGYTGLRESEALKLQPSKRRKQKGCLCIRSPTDCVYGSSLSADLQAHAAHGISVYGTAFALTNADRQI